MTDIEIVAERRVEIIPAKYVDTGVRRFKGNPFIEALPPIELQLGHSWFSSQ